MTNNNHPITPPLELVKQWLAEFYGPESMPGMAPGEMVLHVAAVAARWGADQELEACCKWLDFQKLAKHERMVSYLRAIRRPKPPSLKEQACRLLESYGTSGVKLTADQCNTILRALKALPND